MFNIKHIAIGAGAVVSLTTVAVVAYEKGIKAGVEMTLQQLLVKLEEDKTPVEATN